MAEDDLKKRLTKPIQLADQVAKTAEESHNRPECSEIKLKTERLAELLRQAARASSDLYERPALRIIDDIVQVLEKALALVVKCRSTGVISRLFTITPAAAFKKTSFQLENSIGDVSWLLRASAVGDDRSEYLGLPPIATNEPILGLIWEQIAIIRTGTVNEKAAAAAYLVALARGNERNGKIIIEEGGIPPLLRLLKEGSSEGQENAATAVGLLGRDPESVDDMIRSGVCSAFAKILKDGSMKIKATVAWAISELVLNDPKCRDDFAQTSTIRLLVSLLAFETVQEHSKYAVTSHKPPPSSVPSPAASASTTMSMHSVVQSSIANKNHQLNHPLASSQMQAVVVDTLRNRQEQQARGRNHDAKLASTTSIKGREYTDPETKARVKAMAALALGKLARDNVQLCRTITDLRALLCFAALLEKGPTDVQLHCANALMEIAAVAEKNDHLRQSAFKPNTPAARAVVDQLLRVVLQESSDTRLLLPCVRAIGCLSRTFPSSETRLIPSLVRLLDEKEIVVMREAAIALTQFAHKKNYLHINHSKAIIDSGGVKHLLQLVYLGEQAQIPALVLLCCIAFSVPDSSALADSEALKVLEWASKQTNMMQNEHLEELLVEAKVRLEVYRSRAHRGGGGFH